MLFQWADGNLQDFWNKHPKPDDIPRTHEFATWVLQQLLGLTSGLKTIHLCSSVIADDDEEDDHGPGNVHADLRPEIILWFEQISGPTNPEARLSEGYGRLLISDFGRVQINIPETHLVSPTYQAPEFGIKGELAQSYDIWTLGCLILDFVVWYLEGYSAFERFSNDRASEDRNVIRMDTYFYKQMRAGSNGQTFITATLKVSVVKVRRIPNHRATLVLDRSVILEADLGELAI